MEPPFYRPSFIKHLNSLARSNYFARGLDADDYRFLEYVKRHGIANGGLPNTGVVLLEEIEFWRFPYSVDPSVERRAGKGPREEQSQEAISLRKARWRARLILRKNEKAIQDAELERERREWEAAQAKRKVRDLITDAEWEAAAPERASFGATVNRHYVPEWKLQELGGKAPRSKPVLSRASKKRAEEMEARVQARLLAASRKRATFAEKARDAAKRKQAIAEARATVDRINRLECEWNGTGESYTAESLTQAIANLLNSTPGYVWTVPDLARTLVCTDGDLMNKCLEHLVSTARLRRVDT